MNPAPRTGLLGGTFDPIHLGHLDAARAAVDALDLEQVLLLPSRVPPHRSSTPSASSHHRFAMVAMASLTHARFRASDLEVGLPGPSYTAETLRRLRAAGYDPSQLFFITGADAFAEIDTWKEYPAFLDGSHFVVISRPGAPADRLPARLPALAERMLDAASYRQDPRRRAPGRDLAIVLIDAATSDASSTEIRRRLSAGEAVSEWLVPDVERYVRQHGLYSPSPFGKPVA